MAEASFYYAIFKKLQATGSGSGAHDNADNDPANNFYGGFTLRSTESPYGLFGALAPQATTWGLMQGMQPLVPGNFVPDQNPLYVMLNTSLGTPGSLPDKVTVNGQDWPVMPPPFNGDISMYPLWLDFNATSPRLIDAFAQWIGTGKKDDSPKSAPITFAALSATQVPKFPLKPGETTPILFVASMAGDDGRRHGDHATPDVPANHVPANFWATSQIFLTDASGTIVHPLHLKSGESYGVAAVIGNASGAGAGRVFFNQPTLQVLADAQAFNSFLSPGVPLPSLGNLDPASPAPVYEQYTLRAWSRDVVGFRFDVDTVFAGLEAALAAANLDLGGLTPAQWLADSHPCVKVRIVEGELSNPYKPSDNSSLSLGSDPLKDRHIAQRNLAPFQISMSPGKEIAWKTFIVAQSGEGSNALGLQHRLPADAFEVLLALPTASYQKYVVPTGAKAAGILKGFEPVKTLPPGFSKPFPQAVILRQTAADPGIKIAMHHTPRFFGAAIGIAWDPAKIKPPVPAPVTLSHYHHDGTVAGGFTLQLMTTK